MKVASLERPFSIDLVRDGGVYHMPDIPLVQTNLFLRTGCADNLYLKIPSERGIGDYRLFIRNADSNRADIRGVEEAERFKNLDRTLSAFPDLKALTAISSELAHYLAVHKLQYERLKTQSAVRIPRACYGVVCLTRFGIFRKFEPALFQERIQGTTLWNMFDFDALQVRPAWRHCISEISARLSALLASGLEQHIDWNIQNFIWDDSERELFYVDQKPSLLVAKHSNEYNLKGIRDHFHA